LAECLLFAPKMPVGIEGGMQVAECLLFARFWVNSI